MPGMQKRDDKSAWLQQKQWLLAHWKKLADTLRPHINSLDLSTLSIEQEEIETAQ
jgi:hypothetical protein